MFLEPGGFIVVVVAGGRMMTKTVLIFRTEAPLHCIINISHTHTQISLRHSPPHPHGDPERAHTRHLLKFSEKKRVLYVCLELVLREIP